MPGQKRGPITKVYRLRFEEEDYVVLRNCWVRRNPEGFQTFSEWMRNEMHQLAEECRRASKAHWKQERNNE